MKPPPVKRNSKKTSLTPEKNSEKKKKGPLNREDFFD